MNIPVVFQAAALLAGQIRSRRICHSLPPRRNSKSIGYRCPDKNIGAGENINGKLAAD
ncbi:hypothetical protein [Xenorhabdus santafensis]|uniref:hypothetical protein n=1 Tax=Xenorhabdus santafensis TaxID=2582833 RepID=UPI0029E80A7E|nr:hypothetical protein [Xenorhabdus sp. 12]